MSFYLILSNRGPRLVHTIYNFVFEFQKFKFHIQLIFVYVSQTRRCCSTLCRITPKSTTSSTRCSRASLTNPIDPVAPKTWSKQASSIKAMETRLVCCHGDRDALSSNCIEGMETRYAKVMLGNYT